MSDWVYVINRCNNVIGVYNNEILMNDFINGGIQNNLFNSNELNILKYNMNSIYNHTNYEFKFNNKIDNKIDNKVDNKIDNKVDNTKNKLLNNESYQKIMQQKIDTQHEINELKYKKKLYEESKITYNSDLVMYNKFNEEIKRNEKFKIPSLFILKYNLFKQLDDANELTFETFYEEWEKIKPKNNYNMFGSNSYEESFINKPVIKDINIELDI